MSYTYDINTSKNDKRSTICLSACHSLYAIINLFVTTFLIAHMYSLTTDLFSYALKVGIYQLSTYGTMLLTYGIFSKIVDRTNRVWVYRVACIIEAALVIVTIFYGKDLAKLVILAGVLNGLLHSAYYASYNVLKQEMVSRKSMGNYIVVINIILKVINIVCPILLGTLIELSTYTMVAIYVLIICIIQTIVSFFIRSKRPAESDFNVIKYIKKLKNNPEIAKNVKFIYLIAITYSFINVVSSLLSINIMMHFGSNFSLGLITSVFACVAIVVLILLNRFTKVGKRAWLLILVGSMQLIGAIVFSIIPNVATLLVFNFTLAVCEVIVITVYDIHRNKNLKEAGLYDDIAEHQCIIEAILQIGRIIEFTLLIVMALIRNYVLFQISFVFFMVLYTLTPILLMVYEKKFKIENKE